MINYSQNTEQDYILEYFKSVPKGRCLDIGAYDLKKFSNTRALVEQGWHCAAVECSPSVLDKVYKNLDGLDYQVVPYAIAPVAGTLTFFDGSGDAISSLSVEHTKKWHRVNFKEVKVEAITVKTLLDKVGEDFDFLNLDVESTNLQIFNELPDSLLNRLKLIVVEYDRHLTEMKSKLEGKGFNTLHINGENLIVGKP